MTHSSISHPPISARARAARGRAPAPRSWQRWRRGLSWLLAMAALLRRLGFTIWLCALLLVHQQQTSVAAPPKLLIFTFAESVFTLLSRSPRALPVVGSVRRRR